MQASEASSEAYRSLRALAEANEIELPSLEREGMELKVLARQTMAEIDRLAPQSNELARKVREMEAHIESYTRTEIRSLYAAARDAEMRLFMMQRQLEQIEYKLRNLSRYEKQLRAVVDAIKLLPMDGEEAAASPADERPGPEQTLADLVLNRDIERQRVTRRLHDGPAQSLANLVLRAEICERLFASEPTEAKAELASIKLSIAKALEDTRGLIFELRPMILDDLGPVPTLRRYAQALMERSGCTVNVIVSGTERRLPQHIEVAIFSVIQEALLNAVQHGQPSQIGVSISYGERSVAVAVEDDGRGFDVAALSSPDPQRRRVGLASIDQLVRALSGTFSVRSQPGQGTRVSAEISLPDTHSDA